MKKKQDKKRKQFEKYCLAKLHEISEILLITDYYPIEFNQMTETKSGARAKCLWHYPYKWLVIEYAEEVFDDYKKGKLDDVIGTLVHEMCHPLTDPLYNIATEVYKTKDEVNNLRESLTDHIANIVLKNKLI